MLDQIQVVLGPLQFHVKCLLYSLGTFFLRHNSSSSLQCISYRIHGHSWWRLIVSGCCIFQSKLGTQGIRRHNSPAQLRLQPGLFGRGQFHFQFNPGKTHLLSFLLMDHCFHCLYSLSYLLSPTSRQIHW